MRETLSYCPNPGVQTTGIPGKTRAGGLLTKMLHTQNTPATPREVQALARWATPGSLLAAQSPGPTPNSAPHQTPGTGLTGPRSLGRVSGACLPTLSLWKG